MRRSRIVVASSAAVVALGSALAAFAWYLDPARAAAGPLPAEGLSLPAETRFLMGLDVQRFVASPLYRRMAPRDRPQSLGEIQRRTGLDPEREIDLVVVAGQGEGRAAGGLILVKGGFDRYRVARAIERQGRGVTWKQHAGGTLYVFREGKAEQGGLAFLSDDAFVFGDLPSVQQLLTVRAEGRAPLRNNVPLVGLLDQVRPGAAFWVVGDQSALKEMPRNMPGGAAALPLAALKTVVVSGELEPQLSLELDGQTADEKSARSIGDVVRGFVALAQLQNQSRPELGELAEAISITTEGNRVRLSARFSYEVVDALQRPVPRSGDKAPVIGR